MPTTTPGAFMCRAAATRFVFDLDSHKYIGSITNVGGHGVAIDTATHHGFSSSAQDRHVRHETMQKIKDIDVQGRPDGILLEPFTDKVLIFSHRSAQHHGD
jgi:hypothetical protein